MGTDDDGDNFWVLSSSFPGCCRKPQDTWFCCYLNDVPRAAFRLQCSLCFFSFAERGVDCAIARSRRSCSPSPRSPSLLLAAHQGARRGHEPALAAAPDPLQPPEPTPVPSPARSATTPSTALKRRLATRLACHRSLQRGLCLAGAAALVFQRTTTRCSSGSSPTPVEWSR